MTVPDWTASKLRYLPSLPNEHVGLKKEIAVADAIYNDYHQASAQYKNQTTYEMLQTYHDRFDWRPNMLIMISSDIHSHQFQDDPVLLQLEVLPETATASAHWLCDQSSEIGMKCAHLNSFDFETFGQYTYRSNKIDHALYKATDPVQAKVKNCYLQCSPQILMCMYAFQILHSKQSLIQF